MPDATPADLHALAAPTPDPTFQRAGDPEDLGTLGQMMALGAEYIDDQDEPDEQGNIPKMQQALDIIGGLVAFEVGETEPVEPDDA
jgi:hypothetical protein